MNHHYAVDFKSTKTHEIYFNYLVDQDRYSISINRNIRIHIFLNSKLSSVRRIANVYYTLFLINNLEYYVNKSSDALIKIPDPDKSRILESIKFLNFLSKITPEFNL